MPGKLTGREIFATGKWNGIEFSEEDLDDIVSNFQKLFEKHKVPLKFGHNDEQGITDGQPAIGWVERVYRQGKKLLADFADVPQVVVDAIKNRLYRTTSVELLFNVDNDGRKFNHVLDAVALLGADQPAVSGLADLNTLLATRAEFSGGRREVFRRTTQVKEEGDDMPIKEEDFKELQESFKRVEKKLDEKDEKLAALEKDNKELKDENAKFAREKKEREESAKKEKVELARKSVKEVLNKAVEDKNMTPAVRDTYAKQLGVDDDERVVEIDLDEVKIMCGATKGGDKGEQGRTKKGGGDVDDDDVQEGERADEALLRLAREEQGKDASGKMTLEVAMTRVGQRKPKLLKAYQEMDWTREEA